MRNKITINDGWKFVKKAEDVQMAVTAPGEAVNLPHTWNAKDGQDGGNDYYRGTCWYVKKITKPKKVEETDEIWIEFGAAAMTADVYLNGKKLFHHEGGYSIFRVNLTEELQEENVLAVAVDNSANDHVYPQKADFTFYGGINRDVSLIVVPRVHFELGCYGAPGIKVTPELSEDLKTAKVTVEAWVERQGFQTKQGAKNIALEPDGQNVSGRQVTFQIGDFVQIAEAEQDGHVQTVFELEDVHLWNGTRDPYLYHVTAELSDDRVETDFGLRTFAWDAEKGFFLNGKSYPLCGAARHQDRQGVGTAITKEMMEEDMALMREMGANTVRLAHYQHDQYFYDLCDRYGLVVWAEIPYITQHMPDGRENTLNQMQELVVQSYNHPSIACWGLSNEITAAGGIGEDMMENHRLLNDLCHRLDKTRPTTMAHAFMLEPGNPLVTLPDIRSYNLYYGWYIGELDGNDQWFDDFHEKYPDVVIGLSEYGADANPAYQSGKPEKGDWTEGYQALYHEHLLKMWKERPYIWAMHCWNMFDFGADGRNEGGKPGQNQKGLVTFDRKTKKDAFYIYKAYLSEEKFVHLCGKRYKDRTEKVTEVKVYSNLPEVTLYVDGKELETKQGDKVFCFDVPIDRTCDKNAGEDRSGAEKSETAWHKITAVSGAYQDSMEIRFVTEPNASYKAAGGEVQNWFDKPEEMIREGYFSIFDKMCDIKESPEAAKVLQKVMDIAIASYGDVAKAAKLPEAVQRIQDMQPLEKILKQAAKAFTAEQIKEFNHEFNQIPKQKRNELC